jgi:galactokinase
MEVEGQVKQKFSEIFGETPTFLVRAPGRVNLIGEHTDYNDGFVLPMAIDRAVWIALNPSDYSRVLVYSLDMDKTCALDLIALRLGGEEWFEYLKGVAWALSDEGYKLKGWQGVMAGDIPIGAGLSSSAAVEMAAVRAFSEVSGFEWQPARMAQVGQRAENQWVGVNCGIMDQMVSAAAQARHALFLDCRSLEYQHIPLPESAAVVVMDTSTRRGLVGSAYNERRAQCEEAAKFFGVPALRDVSLGEFNARSGQLEQTVMRRARHIITENQRVLDAVNAMHAGDALAVGRLFNESHGARMTGAGFGGCAVALVKREQVEAFVEATGKAYRAVSGLDAKIYVCSAAQGANLVHP